MAEHVLAVNVTVFLALVTFGLAALLFLVSALSWWRLRGGRLAAVTGAFAVLAASSGWIAWQAISLREPQFVTAGLDALVLILFYASVAKR